MSLLHSVFSSYLGDYCHHYRPYSARAAIGSSNDYPVGRRYQTPAMATIERASDLSLVVGGRQPLSDTSRTIQYNYQIESIKKH